MPDFDKNRPECEESLILINRLVPRILGTDTSLLLRHIFHRNKIFDGLQGEFPYTEVLEADHLGGCFSV